MPSTAPLGLPRVLADLGERTPDPVRAAGIFFAAGLTTAVVRTGSPMSNPRRQIAAAEKQIRQNDLPAAVVLAVYGDEVRVFPAAMSTGKTDGDAIAHWQAGTYRVSLRGHGGVRKLSITPKGGTLIALESKTFPIGPNRYNAKVASLIASLGVPD